jgi:hypothetical protein
VSGSKVASMQPDKTRFRGCSSRPPPTRGRGL